MRVVITLTKPEKEPELQRWPFRAAYYALLLAGLAALSYSGYRLLDAYRYQRLETAKFEAVASTAPETSSPSEGLPVPDRVVTPAISTGNVIGEIEMPRVGLRAIIVQGDSTHWLNRAVGHLPDSALPGEEGNVALAAHRDGLFRPLRKVLPGDPITLRTAEREFQYEVVWTAVVPPTAVGILQPTSEHTLTLVTCFPFYYVGAAPERFVVRAREVKPQTVESTDSVGADGVDEPTSY